MGNLKQKPSRDAIGHAPVAASERSLDQKSVSSGDTMKAGQ